MEINYVNQNILSTLSFTKPSTYNDQVFSVRNISVVDSGNINENDKQFVVVKSVRDVY